MLTPSVHGHARSSVPHVPGSCGRSSATSLQDLRHIKLCCSECREDWIALGPVVEALAFDFADWRANMAPAEMSLRLSIVHGGVWNAVAFWFELELDDETRLSTSPYDAKASDHETRVPRADRNLGNGLGWFLSHDAQVVRFQTCNNAAANRTCVWRV